MNLPTSILPEENSCGCAETSSSESVECMCPATGLVQIVGRKYSLRLLTVIGERRSIRFNDLKFVMDDMSSSTLTIRLTELEQAGLVDRRTYSETPPRVEYSLTKAGSELRRNLFSISKFAARNPETSARLPEKGNG